MIGSFFPALAAKDRVNFVQKIPKIINGWITKSEYGRLGFHNYLQEVISSSLFETEYTYKLRCAKMAFSFDNFMRKIYDQCSKSPTEVSTASGFTAPKLCGKERDY